MIRRILARAAARLNDFLDSRKLARTVRLQAHQLDHLHLLAASEECRADRAEERVAELELQLADWREASGELVAEEEAADLRDAGEEARSPLPSCTCHEADIQRGRAEQAERERDTNARAAGAHIATIEDLRARLDLALRAVHRPAAEPPPIDPPCQCGHRATVHGREGCEAIIDGPGLPVCPCERFQVYGCRPRPAEQIPGVAAACGDDDDPPTCDACGKPARDGDRTGEAEAVLLCSSCHQQARAEEAARPPRIAPRAARYESVMRRSAEIDAGADDPPATKPSERPASPKESSR